MYSLLIKILSIFLVASTISAIPAPRSARADFDGESKLEVTKQDISDLRNRQSCLVLSAAEVEAQEIEEEFELAAASDPDYADAFKVRIRQSGQSWRCADVYGNGVSLSYDVDYIDAINVGWYLLFTGGTVTNNVGGYIRSEYPKRFWNFEGLLAPIYACPGEDLYEYPVFPGSGGVALTYNGGSPGPDRVLFSQCGNPCGVITHRGLVNNKFTTCVLE